MTWRNLGFQPHPWRAAVKAGEGKTSTWGLGSMAGPLPTAVYAGRLRLVLECESMGERCWLAGCSTACPRPMAFCTGHPASPFLPSIQARGAESL